MISREDGGHLVINPKVRVENLQKLTAVQSIELMRLLHVTGDALFRALSNQGIDMGRINYQDNGNWGVFAKEGPYQHFHIYGRAKNATTQKYGESLYFPHRSTHPEFYAKVEPLTSSDLSAIRKEIISLLQLPSYSNDVWRLTE